MTDQAEIDQRAREMITAAAQEAEKSIMDNLTQRRLLHVWRDIKDAIRIDSFTQTKTGRAIIERLEKTISSSCVVWLTSEKPEDVTKALAEARAALAAMITMAELVAEGTEARTQLEQLENEIGE